MYYENLRDVVIEMTEDVKASCDVYDDYEQWYDIASASVESFIEELSGGELKAFYSTFNDYLWEIDNENFKNGLRKAFLNAMENTLDYLDGLFYDDENADEDDDKKDYIETLTNIKNSLSEEF